MVKLDRIEHFVTIPEDVTATLSEDGVVTINGPKGTLTRTFVSTSCKLHEEGLIEVVRVKERFLEAPSGGGWRGLCNLLLISPTNYLFIP